MSTKESWKSALNYFAAKRDSCPLCRHIWILVIFRRPYRFTLHFGSTKIVCYILLLICQQRALARNKISWELLMELLLILTSILERSSKWSHICEIFQRGQTAGLFYLSAAYQLWSLGEGIATKWSHKTFEWWVVLQPAHTRGPGSVASFIVDTRRLLAVVQLSLVAGSSPPHTADTFACHVCRWWSSGQLNLPRCTSFYRSNCRLPPHTAGRRICKDADNFLQPAP